MVTVDQFLCDRMPVQKSIPIQEGKVANREIIAATLAAGVLSTFDNLSADERTAAFVVKFYQQICTKLAEQEQAQKLNRAEAVQ
jgi:hypothetical protein